MARQILYAFLSALIAAAQTVVTGTRMVFKAGRWIAESFRLPQQQAPAAAASAADAMAALAEVTETPAPAKAEIQAEPVDPYKEWGGIAQAFAMSQTVMGVEPDLRMLDEAAVSWLNSLNASELMVISNASANLVGKHMLGERDLKGLPLCPTMSEWEQAKREMSQISAEKRESLLEGRRAIQEALDDLISDPAYVPCRGI